MESTVSKLGELENLADQYFKIFQNAIRGVPTIEFDVSFSTTDRIIMPSIMSSLDVLRWDSNVWHSRFRLLSAFIIMALVPELNSRGNNLTFGLILGQGIGDAFSKI